LFHIDAYERIGRADKLTNLRRDNVIGLKRAYQRGVFWQRVQLLLERPE
jgi:hypothetical protein